MSNAFCWEGLVALACLAALTSVQAAARVPSDGEYVTVRDGHLTLEGRRQRYWGVIGGFPHAADIKPDDPPDVRRRKAARAHADVDALVGRFCDLGFNLNRMWHCLSPRQGEEDYVKGDGSRADVVDYFVAKMGERGLRIWAAGTGRLGDITPGDVDVVNDPATRDAWREAMREWNRGKVPLRNIVGKWDPRFEALAIERRRLAATHFNKHTGLRWSDDPTFVAWELSNEEWWISKMVGGQWLKLPEYWQEMLVARWNGFLRRKYGTHARLRRRWRTLLPGESLDRGSVQLLPLKGKRDVTLFGMDRQGRRQLAEAQAGTGTGGERKYGREDFSRERGEDVMAFFVHLHVSSKRREAEALKTWGKSCRLCPLAWDTGIGYEIQAQYMHQQADVSVHDAYVNGWGWDQKAPESFDCDQCRRLHQVGAEAVASNRGPWNCWLLKPPGICQGVPWLEHNRVEGKPFFCYETQIQQPAKYRADFPLRLGMLASIQDWDVACWHYYAPPRGLSTSDRPFDRAMDVTVGSHPQGYHYTFDEVQTAMMRAAGLIWRQGLLKPAPRPTKFVFGRRSLHDPDSMDYGHSYGRTGLDMLYTVYQHGVRIEIDPSRQNDEVIGPTVSFDQRRRHNPYTPTEEMTHDWRKGYLAYDAPGVAVFAGFLPRLGGRYAFRNGVTLSDVEIENPPGIYDPVTDGEGYVAFALYSEDGEPLGRARKAALSIVSTSFNTGFSLSKRDFERAGCPDYSVNGRQLAADAPEKRRRGGLPVLVARVGAKVEARALRGMRYRMLDWHLKEIDSGRIRGDVLRISSDRPVFVTRLSR